MPCPIAGQRYDAASLLGELLALAPDFSLAAAFFGTTGSLAAAEAAESDEEESWVESELSAVAELRPRLSVA